MNKLHIGRLHDGKRTQVARDDLGAIAETLQVLLVREQPVGVEQRRQTAEEIVCCAVRVGDHESQLTLHMRRNQTNHRMQLHDRLLKHRPIERVSASTEGGSKTERKKERD